MNIKGKEEQVNRGRLPFDSTLLNAISKISLGIIPGRPGVLLGGMVWSFLGKKAELSSEHASGQPHCCGSGVACQKQTKSSQITLLVNTCQHY